MGLLNRRRHESGADRARTAETDPSDQPQSAADRRQPAYEPIRASTLAPPVPEWARVPPMVLSIPEMPSVVSKQFDESLVSWQPPPRFLESLGHSVSSAAPSGVVEGLAVLIPLPAAEEAPAPPPPAQPSLPLAQTPGQRDASARHGHSTTREISFPLVDTSEQAWESSGFEESANPVAPPDAVAPPVDSAAMTPAPAPFESPTAPPPAAGRADLVGDATLTSAPRPLVASLLPADTPSRLVHAPTPPQLPLAQLPSAPMPQRPVASTVTTSLPEAGEPAPSRTDVVGLVGERAAVEPTVSQPAAAASGAAVTPAVPAAASPEPATPQGPSGELPLVSPPVSAQQAETSRVVLPTGDPVTAGTTQPAEGPADPATTESLSGQPEGVGPAASTAPLVGQSFPWSGPDQVPAPSGPSPAVPLQVEGPAGQSQQPLPVPRPPAAPRAGLGEPMSQLPSTSTSWDVTKMSRTEQIQASRALIDRMNAASARNSPGGTPPGVPPIPPAGVAGQPAPVQSPGQLPLAVTVRTPAAARAPLAPTRPHPVGPVLAGTELPLAPLEALAPPATGVAPSDLPPVGEGYAPLLGAEPLAVPETAAGAEGGPAPTANVEGQRARMVVGARHGVDLSRVPVDRSQQGASEATRLRARAFTSDRGIVMPPSVGTLESGPGEALLAHELTHVAQRARAGAAVPSEDSAPGRELEREAASTEMTLNTGGFPRPATPALPVAAPSASSWTSVLNRQQPSPTGGAPLPLAAPGVAGLDADSVADSIIERLSVLGTPGAPGQPGGQAALPQQITISAPAAPAMSGAPVQRAPDETPTVEAPAPPALPGGLSAGPLERPDDADLSNLSRWLYPFIRYRLKGELREDRERAGLLTDHYRRW